MYAFRKKLRFGTEIWEVKRLVDVNELSFAGPAPNISIALENTLGKKLSGK